MNIDYGSRIRAVADHLETVPGDKYNFSIGPSMMRDSTDRCGCVIAHGIDAEIIDERHYRHGIRWLVGDTYEAFNFSGLVCPGTTPTMGEEAKQAAIKALRDYADEHYPVVTQLHTGIPAETLRIFEEAVAA